MLQVCNRDPDFWKLPCGSSGFWDSRLIDNHLGKQKNNEFSVHVAMVSWDVSWQS